LGVAYNNLGQYGRAIGFYEQHLVITRVIGDRAGEGAALGHLGVIYADLGQYERAIDFYKQSLAIYREIGNRASEGVALGNLGSVYRSLGDYESAMDFYEQRLFVARAIGDRAREGTALGHLGVIYDDLGQYERAIDFYKQSLAIAREVGDSVGEAGNLNNLGLTYSSLGQYERAIAFFEQAIALFSAQGKRAEEGIALSNIGMLLNAREQPELAIIFLKASVEVRESIREGIQTLDAELQQSYANTIADDYRFLADLLLEQGRIPEAQQVLDLLKLEELREFTHTTRATWSGSELQYTEVEQPVVDAHGTLIALGQKIYECRQTRCSDLENLRAQQRTLTEEYETRVAEFEAIVADNDRSDDLFQSPQNLSDDAYKLLQANPDAVLIYPFVTDDKLWLLWAAAGGAVGSVEVAVSQGELATVVQQFGERLNSAGSLAELQAKSQQLYRWLIEPLEAELEANNIRQLIFVNDRVTRYIPMAALYDGEHYLLERYTISTVITPAITDTEETLAGIDDSETLGLGLSQSVSGFSPLPAVKQELDAIIRTGDTDPLGIYPGKVLMDEEFTLEALHNNVEFRRILHIATHAEFAPSRPEDSFIVLGNGERMSIQDIETMQESLRDLHLVVLSACKTALGGTAGDGTEIAGISSYFLAANRAETVIASLWAVNDTSTSLLMQRFYELLASGELTKAEALRQAQLSLLYDEDTETRLAASRATIDVESRDGQNSAMTGFQHPYHWAPFILIGNGL
jgi:CHAT domain-containing protein/tetratricopeptide (TPR) repeat protein